ncbi:MAG: hypothetical protein ACRDJF_07350 [Actinomycetota bacterium]
MNEAIAASRTRQVREQSIHLTRLAATYVPEGEVEEACRLAGSALTVAEETGSDRAWQRVRELCEQLEPWSDASSVRELSGRLAGAGV